LSFTKGQDVASNKPRIFIASSKEGLSIAQAINANLDFDTTPTLWPTGTFRLGSNSLDDLVQKSSEVDFAIFVFNPDDVATIRDESTKIVRDNVLFELGIFIGAIGKSRCFIVKPRDSDMHLPTDLLGVNTTSYANDRDDGDHSSATNYACTQIRDEIIRQGKVTRNSFESQHGHHVANPPVFTITRNDTLFLAQCAISHLASPEGLAYHRISNNLRIPEHAISISAIKLLKLGYVEKTVDEDQHGSPYYAYRITENGVDAYLASESILNAPEPAPSPKARSVPNFSDMDDATPF
jgi:hypothetical protein